MTKAMKIKDAAQVEKINRLACGAPYEVYLQTETVILDARSLLALYALVGQTVYVVAEDHVNPCHFGRLVSEMEAEEVTKRSLVQIVADSLRPLYGGRGLKHS